VGKIDNLKKARHTFTLRNEGDGPIEIKHVRSTCGCILSELSKSALQPGKSAEVTAQLDLYGMKGPVRHSVIVESNDPSKPLLRLTLKAEGVERIRIEPPLVLFDRIPFNAERSRSVEITVVDDEVALPVDSVECDLPGFSASVETLEDSARYRLRVSSRPPLQRGKIDGVVTVRTASEDYPAIDIPLRGTVVGELAVSPGVIVLVDDGTEGVTATRLIEVAPGAVKSFRVTGARVSLESAEVNVLETGNGAYVVKLEGLPVSADSNGAGVTITTDVAEMSSISVPIRVVPAQGSPADR